MYVKKTERFFSESLFKQIINLPSVALRRLVKYLSGIVESHPPLCQGHPIVLSFGTCPMKVNLVGTLSSKSNYKETGHIM